MAPETTSGSRQPGSGAAIAPTRDVRRPYVRWFARLFVVASSLILAVELLVPGSQLLLRYLCVGMIVSSLADAFDLNQRWTKGLLVVSFSIIVLAVLHLASI